VRILLDYRPALRRRTGVGEFVHELTKALAPPVRARGDTLAVLTSSWKDRPPRELSEELPGVRIVDRRVPVRVLTWSWNRLGMPPVEWLAGPADLVHGQTLLIPTRSAASVITIHDLDFLHHPERATAETRRDFPGLVREHANRADHVLVPSHYVAGEVQRHLDVPADRLTISPHGAPGWAADIARQRRAGRAGTHLLFVGTLEPRKNIGRLLEAYHLVRSRRPDAGPLVLAGGATAAAQPWIERARRADLAGHVQVRGYVADEERRLLYRDARMLLMPSLDEGFGLPVLEAMACGVPVVISDRGSLPEVAGAAADPVAPDDVDGLANRIERLLDDEAAASAIERGLRQASRYTWEACAVATLAAYDAAVAARAARR
jgi:glycosyltransferase involved in cell wall biosynthesis